MIQKSSDYATLSDCFDLGWVKGYHSITCDMGSERSTHLTRLGIRLTEMQWEQSSSTPSLKQQAISWYQ